ncbi:MAG: hypothetical protein NXI00_23565, partial [Cytophagales bacterium]|nr:hypothetical protein [Cytophagales bacterium]
SWTDYYSTIDVNVASQLGGGVSVSSSNILLEGTMISRNMGYSGGALFLSYANNFTGIIRDAVIT